MPEKTVDVLVLAPRFPAINQPWIDTYLQQLQRVGLSFSVASAYSVPEVYHEKVDTLGLLEHRLPLSFSRTGLVSTVLRESALRPFVTLRAYKQARLALGINENDGRGIGDFLRSLQVTRTLRSIKRIRIVHSHSIGLGYFFLPEITRRNLRMVLTFHGLEPVGVPQIPEHRRLLQFKVAAKVIVNTGFAKKQAIELGCPPEKLVILPQGLPLEDYPFLLKSPPTADQELRLLTVGRFHRDKGQRYAILAARRLKDSGLSFHWDFVGVGPERAYLLHLRDRLGLERHVAFPGALSHGALKVLYGRAHLFVLPSVNGSITDQLVETQGVVLQEAQASGCIPIASRVGGIPECMSHGKDGFLVPHRSSRAIQATVLDLLSRPGEWRSLQEAGRRNVETRFSAGIIGERMAGILTGYMV